MKIKENIFSGLGIDGPYDLAHRRAICFLVAHALAYGPRYIAMVTSTLDRRINEANIRARDMRQITGFFFRQRHGEPVFKRAVGRGFRRPFCIHGLRSKRGWCRVLPDSEVYTMLGVRGGTYVIETDTIGSRQPGPDDC